MNTKPSLLEHVKEVCASRYDVRGEIGRGGMAAVFVAQDLRLNRRVALKVMLPGLAFTEGMAERFEQEARTAANLDHPNIVTIFGVEELDDLFCFVMKYVEGRSLDMVTRDLGALPIDVTHYVLLRVTMALAYAHDEGVVHRDVKPGNVLLDRRGTPVVTDFGIAKAAESPSLTVTGSIIGTPSYMSPEQFMGKPAIPASDQYALGVMAYEMLAGELPFQGSMVQLQMAHIQTIPPAIDEVRRDTPAPLAAVVMRMLAKDAAARFPTLHDAVAALRAIPLDEEGARHRLVELGVLSESTNRFGLASTPLGTNPASRAATPSTPRPAKGNASTVAEDPSIPTPSVAYVRIDPIPSSFNTGEIIPLRGTAYDENNTPIPGKELSWEISPADAGEIRADGTLTVRNPGDITVTATCDGKRSLARVEVTPLPVNRRSPFVATAIGQAPVAADAAPSAATPGSQTPPSASLAAPATPAASAKATPAPAPATAPAGEATEGSSLRRVLTISAGVSAAVLAALLFLVVPRLRNAESGSGATSSTSQGAEPPAAPAPAATPAAGSGAGTASVTQTTNSDSTTAPPEAPATPANDRAATAVASVQIVDPPTTLAAGERVQLQGVAAGSDGARLTSARLAWRSSNSAVASIDGRGVVRGVRPGSVQLTASVGSASRQITLNVTAPTLTSIAIANLRALTVGESSTLSLTARSAGGALDDAAFAATGVTPRWSSSAPEVARVDARSGQLRAIAPGSATIRVEAGSLSASGNVVISAANTANPAATPATTTERPVAPPSAPAPAARSENDVSREIEGALREYAAAVSARDLNAMLKVFPTMAEKDKATWRQFFKDGSEVSYKLLDVELNRPVDLGENAKVTLTRKWSLGFTLSRNQQAVGPTSGSDRVTMSRAGGSWHITQIQ